MITVAILINGKPIVARNAVNKMETNDKGETKYLTDCGTIVWHDPTEGAVVLSKKLLNLIKNDSGVNNENS